MAATKKNSKVFRTVGEFESEMFPEDVARRNEEGIYEHPSEAGARLAEEDLAVLRARKRRRSREQSVEHK